MCSYRYDAGLYLVLLRFFGVHFMQPDIESIWLSAVTLSVAVVVRRDIDLKHKYQVVLLDVFFFSNLKKMFLK